MGGGNAYSDLGLLCVAPSVWAGYRKADRSRSREIQMRSWMRLGRAFWSDQCGVEPVEYIVLTAIVILGTVGAIVALRDAVVGTFDRLLTRLLF